MDFQFLRYAKIALIIGIMLFFTPFIMVSCSNDTEIATKSGFELMVNTTTEAEIEELNKEFGTNFKEDDFKGNGWITFAVLSAGLAWFLLLIEEDFDNLDIIASIASICSVLSLIIFRVTYATYYGLDAYDGLIIIKTQWGYITALLSLSLGAAFCIINAYYNNKNSDKENQTNRLSTLSNYSNEMLSAQQRREGYWKCLCGQMNPPHTTGCSCGLTVSEINNRKNSKKKRKQNAESLFKK